jgi:hypothetical protein
MRIERVKVQNYRNIDGITICLNPESWSAVRKPDTKYLSNSSIYAQIWFKFSIARLL